ncbi:MAG: L,D-transpeptidase [Gemmatimonadaceae bacterium]|jgi:lipoprotein-anchoring transpeptidase ErfK/SrfK|nr:L,D-transpeptidase [Gemmatimonadaceae bacterium]MCC6430494.1 L,D-transpeptidase [Gemmatimonadaceae bacterium]
MRSDRVVVQCLLAVLACGACTTTDTERSAAVATRDSTAVAVDTARASAAADSALRDARLSRLRTLQPTVDDLAARDTLDIRVEVDIQARRVRILDARSDTLAQHAIAVGSKEWPTRTGEWRISQVVLNPEWIPPTDESWAKDEKNSLPGDPDNPLGRAQLVYDLPRSIHGTNAPATIGKAVSHGSIRATNATVLALAELLLTRTGVEQATVVVQEAQRDRRTKRVVDLPQLVPIRVF